MTSVHVIVPMRAGSQTVHRKNVRAISNTQSLASIVLTRALNFAQYTRLPTRVTCATDDPQVASLAHALGVNVHYRQPVDGTQTLAEAAADADSGHNSDILVVLQATTPWLSIGPMLETFEAVTDHGHMSAAMVTPLRRLAWSYTGEPLHQKRTNRQHMMPEVFVETGGMHVCRGVRFDPSGQPTLVVPGAHYMTEVDNTDGFDIDEDDDLLAARAEIARRRRVLYVAYGHPQRGSGHVRRGQLIAEELELHCTVELFCPDIDQHPHPRWGADYRPTVDDVGRYDCLIVDMLDSGAEWVEAANRHNRPVVAFERNVTDSSRPMLRINELLPVGEMRGPQFATIDSALRGYPTRQRTRPGRVLVAFGGTDINGWTVDVAAAIADTWPDWTVVVPPNVTGLLPDQVERFEHVGEFAYQLWAADIAVLGRGRTCFEAAYLGTPFVSVAQNELERSHVQLASGAYLELHGEPVDRSVCQAIGLMVEAHESGRARLDDVSAGLRGEVDGRGVERCVTAVLAAINW